MTEKKRVLVNVIATYGRSLFAIACGLFAGRWTLMALGEVDYGLYGVIGGLTGFIAFLNGLMASAVGRFYAYSVGQSQVKGGEGIEVCRKWFSTAVLIHTVVPLILIILGYPAAEWAVRHFITVPTDRIEACVTVLRCTCITCFIGMVNVPFSAMYTAKQYIAELTIYSFVQTALNVVFLYYMVSHPGEWLSGYAIWSCLLNSIPMAIIAWRAMVVFPECRIKLGYLYDGKRFKELFTFAAYRFGGAVGDLLNEQGVCLLVNKTLGPAKNAAMTVGNTISGHTQTFAGAISGALYPVITNACGAGELEKMRKWSFSACKFATFFSLIFVVPLLVEIDEVMRLWLKNPPDEAALLAMCFLVRFVLENMSCGHYMAIFSVGDIKGYQLTLIVLCFFGFGIVAMSVWLYKALISLGVALIITRVTTVVVRLHYGLKVAGLSISHWFKRVCIPLTILAVFSLAAGVLVTQFMEASFARVVVTTGVCEIVMCPLYWFLCLENGERDYLRKNIIDRVIGRFRR